MPTPTKGPRFGGSPAHQRLILSNLATALFEHGRITTTEAKARRLRPVAEKLITKAKRGDLHNRREVLKTIRDKSVVHTLFTEIAPTFSERPGGYTRITKIGPRKGDNAPMAVIELVTEAYEPAAKAKKKPAKKATPKAAPVEETPAEEAPAEETPVSRRTRPRPRRASSPRPRRLPPRKPPRRPTRSPRTRTPESFPASKARHRWVAGLRRRDGRHGRRELGFHTRFLKGKKRGRRVVQRAVRSAGPTPPLHRGCAAHRCSGRAPWSSAGPARWRASVRRTACPAARSRRRGSRSRSTCRG